MAETEIHGICPPAFEAVREAFVANFAEGQEMGARFAVALEGQVVVDLWAGQADRTGTRAFDEHTLTPVFSTTKAMAALMLARLVSQGRLDYAAPVAEVWPEFAQAGKAAVTVEQALSHQAGLPGFIEPTTLEDQYDFAGCVAKLERQAPAWTPGAATSYHAMTFGWLAGEVIRRVSGMSPGAFVAQALAGPLAADIFIGLPIDEEPRVAEIHAPRRAPETPPLSRPAMMALTNPAQRPGASNARAWRAAEIPAANGQASALGLARLYAALVGGGELEDARILSADGVARLTAPATADGRVDQFLGFTDAWAMGVALNRPGIYGRNPDAYGHSGWGGSFGCADPDAEVAIGYVCNQMGPELVGDPRTAGLCQAVLECAAKA
jgi:CubicO group peptidase (beta-lactamase class C family)